MSALVSVIVTTKNSAGTLEACLSSIKNQSCADLEILVVDNFSRDETPEIARRLATKFEQVGPERSRQRNRGAELASGSWLLFLDSDMILAPEVVAECLAEQGQGFCALIVPEVSKGVGYWSACKALERACYIGDDSIEAARFIQGKLFWDLGGFDEDLTGPEDWELTARIRQAGQPIGRTQTPLIHDEGRLGFKETVRTKFYYGRTMPRYLRKHPGARKGQLTLFRPAFFRHRDLLLRHPALTSGMFVMKTAEAAAGALGMVSGLIRDRRR
jgi:glycosyltransferase involved in cell wall biosynthesis